MTVPNKKNWYQGFKEWIKPDEPESIKDIKAGGHKFPGLIKVGNSPLVLNGAGLRNYKGINIYALGLYLPQFVKRADTAKALIGARRTEIVITHALNATEFVESLREGIWTNTNETARDFIKLELSQLEDVMSELVDMVPGDVVDFDWIPKKGTYITYNGEVLGSPIRGKALYDAVLSIWLGEEPKDPPLKEALLQGGKRYGL